MLKYTALVSTLAVVFAFALPSKPVMPVGPWQVDSRHSDAQLITDATTNYGKAKINFAVGVARVTGTVRLEKEDSSLSSFDISMYPAASTAPVIGEDGKIKSQWFSNLANHTLICFHSKGTSLTPDGRLRTSGTLVVTRVDRNVQYDPTEAYSGPIYGPPIIHRVTHQATFVFDSPAAPSGQKTDAKDIEILTSGSTKVITEDFPQLYKTVMATYWPPVVLDEKCQMPSVIGEDFSGPHCTGTYINPSGLPEEPRATPPGEDFPGTDSGFNSVVGNQVTIVVHLRLKPAPSQAHAASGK